MSDVTLSVHCFACWSTPEVILFSFLDPGYRVSPVSHTKCSSMWYQWLYFLPVQGKHSQVKTGICWSSRGSATGFCHMWAAAQILSYMGYCASFCHTWATEPCDFPFLWERVWWIESCLCVGFCQAWWRLEVLIKRYLVKRRSLHKANVYHLLPEGMELAAALRLRSLGQDGPKAGKWQMPASPVQWIHTCLQRQRLGIVSFRSQVSGQSSFQLLLQLQWTCKNDCRVCVNW